MRSKSMVLSLSTVGLLACAAIMLTATACNQSPSAAIAKAPPQAKWLTVVTPHNEKIRSAFQNAFSSWYAKNHGTSVYFTWIARGTPECIEYVTTRIATDSRDDQRSIPDIMFGGGVADHSALAESGQSVSIDIGNAFDGVPAAVSGLPTRDADGKWYATGLSSFGILFNRADCEARGLPTPRTWTDLAAADYCGWMGIANPAHSGSTRECLLLMIQDQGWEQGWASIVRLLANANALVDRSSVALHQVETGVSLASLAVNFDGMACAAESNGKLTYINPPGRTAVNPNAVSVLASCKDKELATEFVKFCLSDEGQKVWGLRADALNTEETLFHYPIKPNVYEQFTDQLALTENPFLTQFGLTIDSQARRTAATVLVPLVQAASGDNHVLLQQAWQAIAAAGLPEDQLAELTKPPFGMAKLPELATQIEAGEEGVREKLIAEWSNVFKTRYETILSQLSTGK